MSARRGCPVTATGASSTGCWRAEESAVHAELARGEIDPRRLLESGDMIFVGW